MSESCPLPASVEPLILQRLHDAHSYDKQREPCGCPLPLHRMSGFEIVGVISGSATLAGVSLKIIHQLSVFVAEARDAHNVAKDLQEKIEQLHACSQTVGATSSRREEQLKAERPGQAERNLWGGIDRSLGQCQRVLTKFEGALKGLKSGKAELSWLEKGLLQLKLDNRDPEIRRLESKIDTYLQTLQISILCVQM